MKKNNILAIINILGVVGIAVTAILKRDGGQFAALFFLALIDIVLAFALE